MTDPIDREDSPHLFMEERLYLQALKNKRVMDKSVESFEAFASLEKKDLLKMLFDSTVLLYKGGEFIGEQRSSLTRFQMNEIQRNL